MGMILSPNELRQSFLDFYAQRGHKVIPSAPLVPENDPTTLFTSAGMQPLVPFLLGEKHPGGKRLTNSQLCVRADDVLEVGDNRHTTFFEMLGNWSLGDYYKKEQLSWVFEFLTKVVGLDPARLYVTVFAGNDLVEGDKESIKIWQSLFKTSVPAKAGKDGFDPRVKIYLYEAEKNWWSRQGTPDLMPVGEPGGPSSEVFFDFDPTGRLKIHENSPFVKEVCSVNCDCGRWLEVGNSVFMGYRKNQQGSLDELAQKNIDFGGGFERILAAHIDDPDMFRTALFKPLIDQLETSGVTYQDNAVAMRVIADHLRGAVFMAREGLTPGNKHQGYLMRRLIRRSVVKLMSLELPVDRSVDKLSSEIVKIFKGVYFGGGEEEKASSVLNKEARVFAQTAKKAIARLEAATQIDGKFLFDLHQSYGLLIELSEEILAKEGRPLTLQQKREFEAAFTDHQKKSRAGSEKMFKGGLADSSAETIGYHTVTHLLHESLRRVLGNHVCQVGSNITKERLRFDFTHSDKLTETQVAKVAGLVNDQIKAGLPIVSTEMSIAEAEKQGALAFFAEKYGDQVRVYSIGDFSKEVCGGPHVSNTRKLRYIKITKQESVGAGRRRLYAVFKEDG